MSERTRRSTGQRCGGRCRDTVSRMVAAWRWRRRRRLQQPQGHQHLWCRCGRSSRLNQLPEDAVDRDVLGFFASNFWICKLASVFLASYTPEITIPILQRLCILSGLANNQFLRRPSYIQSWRQSLLRCPHSSLAG